MQQNKSPDPNSYITLFLCRDVMTSRGIDQILPHPGDPFIPEFFMETAKGNVALAVAANGPITLPDRLSFPGHIAAAAAAVGKEDYTPGCFRQGQRVGKR